MQAALRKPHSVWFWTDLEAVINKVIHKKREQLGQLRSCGLGIGVNEVFIVQSNRMTEIELRELLGSNDPPALAQPKKRNIVGSGGLCSKPE